MSFLSALPKPKHTYRDAPLVEEAPVVAAAGVKEPPAYGKRRGYIPRRCDTFSLTEPISIIWFGVGSVE